MPDMTVDPGSGAAHSDISLTSHPFGQMPDPDPSQLWQQINECLDGLCGKKTVVEQLLEKGHSELLAQVCSAVQCT